MKSVLSILSLTATEQKLSSNISKFEVGPFNSGYGHTVGNLLRRILLSSIRGASIVSVKFDGVSNEFEALPGVTDTVLSLMLKLKKVRVMLPDGVDSASFYLEAKGSKDIYAKDIKLTNGAKVVNGDAKLTTIDEGELNFEGKIEAGFGYVSAEDVEDVSFEEGYFLLDAIYSPVLSVEWEVQDMRVGQVTNLDKLVIKVETDGTVSPLDALKSASSTASVLAESLGQTLERVAPFKIEKKRSEDLAKPTQQIEQEIMDTTIEEMNLSARTLNVLKNNNLMKVSDILGVDLGTIKGIGAKSMEELKSRLSSLGLKV